VKDFPIHVDFMRLGEGATIRISVPLHVQRAESSPGVKRGGTVNIVTHTIDIECSADNIPQYLEIDVGSLEIGHSLHLSDITLPKGVRTLREDLTLVTIVPPSGYAEEQKAAAAAAAGAAAGTAAAPAAGAAAPAAGAAAAPAAGAAAPAAGAKAPAAAAKAPAGGGDKKK
jgi:large subunit ribosomal protein L25